MGAIKQTRNGIFVADTSRPVAAVSKTLNTVLRIDDAARVFGMVISDIVDAADKGATIKTPYCGDITFSWPPLGAVKKTWPNYPVQTTITITAHPCTIHCQTPGPHGHSEDWDVRSIRATRLFLQLTEREFDMVVHRLPGWQQVCPPHVAGITVHAPGYTFVNPIVTPGVMGRKFFELRKLSRSVRVRLTSGHPQNFGNMRDIPDFVLNNAVWV